MRWIMLLMAGAFLVLAFMSVAFFIDTAGLEKSFKETCIKKEAEVRSHIEEIKGQIKKEMGDKYNDGLASLEKIIKDFKNEKVSVKDLPE